MLRHCQVVGLALGVVVGLSSRAEAQGRRTSGGDSVLRAIGSVRISENDTLFVSRPTEIALGSKGHVYVSEDGEGRVLEIAPSGRITRVFGRKGRGPGELMSPSTVAVGGDSLLVVWDRNQHRLSFFSLRTGAYERSHVLLGINWPPAFRVVGSEVLIRSYDWDAGTSLARVTSTGQLEGSEGVLPALGIRNRLLMEGAFSLSVFAVLGSDVFAMFELSPTLYRWARGTRTAAEISIPAVRRRGVKPENFERMFRDPDNQALLKALMWDRSIPMALETVAPGMLGILTMDVDMDWEKNATSRRYYLSLFDASRNRACVDNPIPAVRDTISFRDALPVVAVSANTLVILQQDVGKQGESVAMLHRYRIDPTQCAWTPLGAPGR